MEMFFNHAVLYVVNLDYIKNERNNLFWNLCVLAFAHHFREFLLLLKILG